MDGRWKLCLAAGLVAGAVGCNTAPKQLDPGAPVVQKPVTTAAQLAKAAPPPPPAAPRTNLKPDTYVTMGALKEQAADEVERPAADREAFRHQARQSYQKAVQVDPKYTPAYVALGASYLSSGERDQAQAMFKKAAEVAPADATTWSEIGAAQARAKDWPAAVQSLTRAHQLDPGNKQIQSRLGFTLARGGWYEEALNTLVKCMPEAEARYNLSRMMQHNKQGDAADVQLRLAAQMDPTYETARTALAAAAPVVDPGVRQVGYQAPADPQAGSQPARLPPVMLGGTEPTAVGVAGRGE